MFPYFELSPLISDLTMLVARYINFLELRFDNKLWRLMSWCVYNDSAAVVPVVRWFNASVESLHWRVSSPFGKVCSLKCKFYPFPSSRHNANATVHLQIKGSKKDYSMMKPSQGFISQSKCRRMCFVGSSTNTFFCTTRKFVLAFVTAGGFSWCS
jgi:hypothetical protein